MICLKDFVPKDVEGLALVMLCEIEGCSEGHDFVEHVVLFGSEYD